MFAKKKLSLLLVVVNLFQFVAFSANAEEEEKYMRAVDISEYFNAKVYLSEENAGTVGEVQSPDYFINSTGTGTAVAINRDTLLLACNDGVLRYNGTEYLMPVPENEDGSVYCYPGLTIDVPDGFYSEYKFLAISCGTTIYHETLYTAVVYSDGTTSPAKGIYIKQRTNASDKTNHVIDAGMLFASEEGTVSGSGDIYEYTFKVPDITKKVKSINFASVAKDTQVRLLALTCIEPDNETLDSKISEHLSELPAVDEVGFPIYEKLTEVEEYVNILNERNVSEEAYDGLAKYNQYLKKIDELSSDEEKVIYVDDDGDDESLTSKPLKTLNRAKNVVRKLKERYPEKTYRVVFREGTYRFDETVSFNEKDSGTDEAPVIYEGAKGEKVQFKGSKTIDISAIEPISDENVKARLKADVLGYVGEINLADFGIKEIPEFESNGQYEAITESPGIYLNGKEQPISQFPNGNGVYAIWESVLDAGESDITSNVGGTIAVSDDEVTRWQNADSMYVGGYFGYDFRYARVNVKKIENKTITLQKGCESGIINKASKRWKAFNLLEEIDMPGEWFIDKNTLMFYYYKPYNAENSELEISTLSSPFIEMQGSENIEFKNIEFSQSNGIGIHLKKNTNNITVTNCSFENISKSAIKTAGNVKGGFEPYYNYLDAPSRVTISDCDFYNIGGSAVFMRGGGNREELIESENKIINNYIDKVSQNARNLPAVMLQGGMGITVENNVIHNTPFHAINFFGNDHKIRYNEIENACNEATDAAVIYSGRSYIMRGSEVSYNFIHDFRVHDDKIPLEQTSAIYLDDMMSGVAVHHNIIVNGQTGIHVSGGQDNDIENNILLGLDRVFYTGNPGDDPNKLGDLPEVAELAITYPGWSEKYPDILKTIENPGPPHRNVIRYNLSDRTPSVIKRFIELGTVSDNLMTEEDIFSDGDKLDYRVKSDADIISELPNILTDSNFDIENIGLEITDNRTTVNPKVDEKSEFVKYYPENNKETVNPYDCVFSWEEAQYADSYKLVIASDENMENVVFEEDININLCHVKNLDTSDTKYYWQVYAKNHSRQNNSEWSALEGVYSFKIKKNWIYESDSKPGFAVDISAYCNEKAFLKEGETDAQDTTYLNMTKLNSVMEKNRNSLNVDGVVYKLPQVLQEYKAINTSLTAETEIPLENENCEAISFLASGYQAVYDYPVRVYYTDESFTEMTFDIGGYNSLQKSDGSVFTPVFKLGTVTTGKNEAGGYIYKFDIPTEKQVSKIVFGNSAEVLIFAITEVLPDMTETFDGKLQFNVMLNGDNKNNLNAVSALTDDSGKLVSVNSKDIEFAGDTKEKLIKIYAPENDGGKMNLYLWNGEMKPYSYKITREVK